MAKNEQDWRTVLGGLRDQIDKAEQAKIEKEHEEKMHDIRQKLCHSFIRCGRVVISEDTAKIDYAATLEAIRDGDLEEDIENLIESAMARGELVVHEYELYSLQALIQQPFWDSTTGTAKPDCKLTIDQIKNSIFDKYPWMSETSHLVDLDIQLQTVTRKGALAKSEFISDGGDEQYVFIKRNMPQLNPMDGGLHNPFLHDPFTGKL